MSSIPANLYFGPEVPDNALTGAIFNDGTCLYRGGDHGWLYMCHISTIRKIKHSPLIDYAIDIPEGELASLNEPMATYRNGEWLALGSQLGNINVIGLVIGELNCEIPDDSVFITVTNDCKESYSSHYGNLNMMLRHEGENYRMDSKQHVPYELMHDVVGIMLSQEIPVNDYLDLDISARFVVNTDTVPVPGDTWVDNEFNEFVFSPTKVWEYIGKLPFNYKGSMQTGIDVLRTMGPHQTGDTYLVDNFVYVYNAVVNRFVVIQCAPGSDDVPFNLYPPGALEPIPIQGIYRRSTDAMPSEPNGCGYLVIEEDGRHTVYNQYGLSIAITLPESVEHPDGKRAPLVAMGDERYRDMCYQWDGLYPEDGDVWLYERQLRTYYRGEWRVLPAGIPYTSRHKALAARVQELKERIKLGQEAGRPLLSDRQQEQLFEHWQQEHNQKEIEAAWADNENKQREKRHPIRAWFRRLFSSKAR